MTKHFNQLVETNEELNKAAVKAGCADYRAIMDDKTAGLPAVLRPLSVLLLPVRLVQMLVALEGYHNEAKDRAIDTFKSHRRDGSVDTHDLFYDRLLSVRIIYL